MKLKKIIYLLLVAVAWSGCKNPDDNKSNVESQDETQYLEKGKEIASATFTVLSSNLKRALEDGDVSGAIAYCNLQAYPLTDSLAELHNATIRRVSLLTRNPQNNPTVEEKQVLVKYGEQMDRGEVLRPLLRNQDGRMVFHSPILVNQLCLQCHGTPGQNISDENLTIIKNHYPDDRATGYKDGDLRGMWSITFNK